MEAATANHAGLEQAYEAVLSEKHYLENTKDPSGYLPGVEEALKLIEGAKEA